MPSEPGAQLRGGRLGRLQVGDRLDRLGAPLLGSDRPDFSADLDRLGGVGKKNSRLDGDNFEGSFLDPSVSAVILGVGDGDVVPRKLGQFGVFPILWTRS